MSGAPSFGPANSSSAMQHDITDVTDEMFENIEFTPSGETLDEDDEDVTDDDDNPYDEFLSSDQPQFEAGKEHLRLVEETPRSPKAKAYERKVAGLFAIGVKVTIANPHTIADSAAMLMHGPNISEKAGDLAAVNPRVATIIDAITDQTENPTTALIIASGALALQLVRNHEPRLEAASGFSIPIGRKRKLKVRLPFKIRLGKRIRNLTHEPDQLTVTVLGNPDIKAALAKQGIIVN